MDVYPLRSITFVAELIHPQKGHVLPQMQKIHHLAFADERTRYANFQVIPGGVQLSNPPTSMGAVSTALILPDRLRIQEQQTGISRDDFQSKVESLARLAMEQLEIPAFVAQQFLIQSLVNPRSSNSSPEFLAGSIMQIGASQLECFDRKPSLVGLRLSFPMSQEEASLFNVRLESYERDRRSVFIENVGVFRESVEPARLADLAGQFDQTYAYIEGPILQFISQFDSSRP